MLTMPRDSKLTSKRAFTAVLVVCSTAFARAPAAQNPDGTRGGFHRVSNPLWLTIKSSPGSTALRDRIHDAHRTSLLYLSLAASIRRCVEAVAD
jgi:hypothetical protein